VSSFAQFDDLIKLYDIGFIAANLQSTFPKCHLPQRLTNTWFSCAINMLLLTYLQYLVIY